MYIRKNTRKHKSKTYTNYLLVESVQTPKGPRQRTICSLGDLEPAPQEEWLALAHKLEASLQGQLSMDASEVDINEIVAKARRGKKRTHFVATAIGSRLRKRGRPGPYTSAIRFGDSWESMTFSVTLGFRSGHVQ